MIQQQQKQSRKINGFQCPWHLHQIIIDFLFIYQIIIYFIVIFPIQNSNQKIAYTTIYVFLIIMVLVFAVIVTLADPTQTMVRIHYDQQFKNRQGMHKIKNIQMTKYCKICNNGVQQNTKHCYECNRCCQQFDHHCKYLNNCIGWNNYKSFFLLLIFLFLFLTVQIAATIAKINEFFNQREQYMLNIKRAIFVMQVFKYNAFVVFTAIISPILLFLDSMLLFFHIYLNFKGLSSYTFYLLQKNNLKIADSEHKRKKQIQQDSKTKIQSQTINKFENSDFNINQQ